MEIWLKPDRNASTCEATLLEQARRVKAAKTGTRVLVYRQALWALSWMESVRAVMYDPAFAGYFLRDKNGAVWREPPQMSDTERSQNPAIIPLCTQPAGECAMWNWTNASARRYFQEVVVGGPRGTGSDLVDGCASLARAPLPLIFSYKSEKSLCGTAYSLTILGRARWRSQCSSISTGCAEGQMLLG